MNADELLKLHIDRVGDLSKQLEQAQKDLQNMLSLVDHFKRSEDWGIFEDDVVGLIPSVRVPMAITAEHFDDPSHAYSINPTDDESTRLVAALNRVLSLMAADEYLERPKGESDEESPSDCQP